MDIRFGQVIHISTDRNNRDAIEKIFTNLGKKDEPVLSAAKGLKAEDIQAGVIPEALVFTNNDAVSSLYEIYGMSPLVSDTFLRDRDLSKLYLATQFDPGAAAFFQDINNYFNTQAKESLVRDKLFAHFEKQQNNSVQTNNATQEPVINIIV